jgi:hypothetical protein
MTRNPMLRGAAVLLVLLLGVLVAGGPEHAGALAGLTGSGAGTAVGLLWIVLFPAVVLFVPPLVFTAAAEALHGAWQRAQTPQGRRGLGSRSRPGDT